MVESGKRMRIGIVVCAVQMGGVETVLKRLYRFFEDAGHQVAFVETNSRGRWADEFETAGLPVVDVLPRPTRSRVHHARRIARALQQYDVVFLNATPFAQSVLGLLREETVTVAVLHAPIFSMIETVTANASQCDAVVAVSPGLRDVLVSQYGVPEDRAACICNGVEVGDRWPKSDAAFSEDSCLRVAYFGRVEDVQKGVLLLPGILKTLKRLYPRVSLEVIGDGPDLKRLREEFLPLCASRVEFHGAVPHARSMHVLRKQHAIVMPSRYEGLPMILLEAMAAGVVPVAAALRGITDHVIEDGKNGLLVPVDDVSGFARALARLGSDRSVLGSMSKAAWERVRENFRLDTMGKSYLELVARLSAARKAGSRAPRSHRMDTSLLGDLPGLPLFCVRPCRKILRTLRLWPPPPREASFFVDMAAQRQDVATEC